ncbi:hypothetical protein [Halomonas sp. AOP42-D2-25]|uniref:hypothetical protein n=1 Tax=Halomonas sp. AOP42-D2-25 TaxID=3457666 RepID=UPI004033EE4F
MKMVDADIDRLGACATGEVEASEVGGIPELLELVAPDESVVAGHHRLLDRLTRRDFLDMVHLVAARPEVLLLRLDILGIGCQSLLELFQIGLDALQGMIELPTFGFTLGGIGCLIHRDSFKSRFGARGVRGEGVNSLPLHGCY